MAARGPTPPRARPLCTAAAVPDPPARLLLCPAAARPRDPTTSSTPAPSQPPLAPRSAPLKAVLLHDPAPPCPWRPPVRRPALPGWALLPYPPLILSSYPRSPPALHARPSGAPADLFLPSQGSPVRCGGARAAVPPPSSRPRRTRHQQLREAYPRPRVPGSLVGRSPSSCTRTVLPNSEDPGISGSARRTPSTRRQTPVYPCTPHPHPDSGVPPPHAGAYTTLRASGSLRPPLLLSSPPSSVPRSAAAPIPRWASADGAASRAAACSPPDLTPPASWGGPGTAADGLAAALEAADPRLLPVDLSPRGDPAPIPRLSAISPRRLPLASPPAPDVSALHACLAQLEGIAPAPAPRAPRVAPFKEAPSPAPAASPGLSASPFLSASEEERRAPSSGGAGGPSTSGGEEESLRAGSAFAPAAEELEGDEAAPAPAAPPSRAARRKKKKGQ
eukprot:tig00021070_g17832.t1